jgi:hypothetical protein
MTYLRNLFLTLALATTVNGCSSDSTPDAGPDASLDVGPEVSLDAGAETGSDAAPDVDEPGATEVGDATDVASTPDVAPDATGDASTLCRVTDTFTFGFVGGQVASSDESVLSPPSQYQHVRMHFRSDGGTTMCAPVPDCQIMNSLGLVEVVAGLNNSDVREALAQPQPLVYGHDNRPVDGQIYSIMRADGHGLLVGSACTAGGVSCLRAIPGGIAAWVQAWQAFDSRMLARPECSAL